MYIPNSSAFYFIDALCWLLLNDFTIQIFNDLCSRNFSNGLLNSFNVILLTMVIIICEWLVSKYKLLLPHCGEGRRNQLDEKNY